MKYKIGDTVWYAKMKCIEGNEPCPDCFGQKALTVIKGDGSQVSIECVGCTHGYEEPLGYVKYSKWIADVNQVVIHRVEVKPDGLEYGHTENYGSPECDLFDNKEDAEKRAIEILEKHNNEEISRIHQKEKHNRTWAWNVHYHSYCIRRAEKDIAYHTAKLSVAKSKVKEEKINIDKK